MSIPHATLDMPCDDDHPKQSSPFQALTDFITQPLQRAALEHEAYLRSPAARDPDVRVIAILLASAFLLTARQYCFTPAIFAEITICLGHYLPGSLARSLETWLADSQNQQLGWLLYWMLGQALVYVAGPILLIKCVFRESLADYGANWRGCLAGWPIYAGMFVLMLPAVLLVSRRASFLHTYPFYRLVAGESLWPRFIVWELAYAVQFVSLEFFFRGFLLLGLRKRFGAYAIFVMMIPYCMIHFGKPLLETCGAIGAGVALGFMSLKTRSIWLGAALHIGVAWTMDAAALLQRTP